MNDIEHSKKSCRIAFHYLQLDLHVRVMHKKCEICLEAFLSSVVVYEMGEIS